MMDLKSSTAVVTGAGRGLGAAISQSLVEEGVKFMESREAEVI